MHLREVQIEDDKSVGDSGTLTVDINVKDPITALIVRFKAQNDTSALSNQPPERQISKVEIVDGGQAYYSLMGEMAVAAAVNGLGRWPHHWYDERPSVNQRCNFPIMFGRFLGDPEFGFDPTRLVNPQLKVTWADQAGYLDDSLTIGVTARVMEGVPAPAKALLWKEVETWTTASSGVRVIDLPTDYPFRQLMIRCFKAGAIPSSTFTNFKLDCDVGKLIPFDLASHEFRDILKQYFGPYMHRQFIYGTATTKREAWFAEVLASPLTVDAAGYIGNAINMFYSYSVVDIIHHSGTTSTSNTVQMLVTGLFPHSCYIYPFGLQNDPATWFKSAAYGDIDLKITEAVADGEGSVAVQQPRSLP